MAGENRLCPREERRRQAPACVGAPEGRDLFPVRAPPGGDALQTDRQAVNRRNRIHPIAKSRLSRSGMRQENPFHSISPDR